MIQRYLRSESAQTHSSQGAPHQARVQIPAAIKHLTTVPRFGSAGTLRLPTTFHQPEGDSHLPACGSTYCTVFTIRISYWFHEHGSFFDTAHTSTHDFTMASTAWTATTSPATPSTTWSGPMQQTASGRVQTVSRITHTITYTHTSIHGNNANARMKGYGRTRLLRDTQGYDIIRLSRQWHENRQAEIHSTTTAPRPKGCAWLSESVIMTRNSVNMTHLC